MLQSKVKKWKDEYGKRRNILQLKQELENEVQKFKTNRGRGRLPKHITDMQKQIDGYDVAQRELKGRGPDPFKGGKDLKNWQIKGVEDRERRSLENIFSISKDYQEMMYKLKNKDVIIWDDNYSSGATLDDACLTLQKLGVRGLIAMTLGSIPITAYDKRKR